MGIRGRKREMAGLKRKIPISLFHCPKPSSLALPIKSENIKPQLTFPKKQINSYGDEEERHEAEHDAEFVPDRRSRVVFSFRRHPFLSSSVLFLFVSFFSTKLNNSECVCCSKIANSSACQPAPLFPPRYKTQLTFTKKTLFAVVIFVLSQIQTFSNSVTG